MVLSMVDGGYAHLFAFHPVSLPLTRLTNNPWDDVDPAISPDGTRVAFRSRQNGYWDLLLLDLGDASLTRLTDTPAYDGSPSWSPDGNWIAYETYAGDNLELCLLSVESPGDQPICLPQDASAEHSPAWAPTGRHIAFVSDRSGEPEIWVADLDQIADRYVNYSNDPAAPQSHPAWSPDGSQLIWSSLVDGTANLQSKPFGHPGDNPGHVACGSWPRVSPADGIVASLVQEPTSQYLTMVDPQSRRLVVPLTDLPGTVLGFDWSSRLFQASQPASFQEASLVTPTPLWGDQPLSQSGTSGRYRVVPLDGNEASPRYLSDAVDDAFLALRDRLVRETGWDVFAQLENAYLTLTDALPPGMENDWLYTGRAITFSTTPLSDDWMVVGREDFGVQTFWRVYLKTHSQDGSQGTPLHDHPWDLDARLDGSPNTYDQGGKSAATVPPGYWVDLTDIASRYGWTRVAALFNWRTFYQGAHLNELVHSNNLDWQAAMLELYPPEALITPTAILLPSKTPNRVPAWVRPQLATPTPTNAPAGALPTPTLNPTWTPQASLSP
jgi:TolB protein